MNDTDDFKDRVKSKLMNMVYHVLAILIDTLFLCCWLAIQYGTSFALELVKLSSLDSAFLLFFQVVFALSTFVPVLLFFYKDIRIMHIKMSSEISSSKVSSSKRVGS